MSQSIIKKNEKYKSGMLLDLGLNITSDNSRLFLLH